MHGFGSYDYGASLERPTDGEFAKRLAPKSRVPSPLLERDDFVGGLETIHIGGKRYWYGFAPSSDDVLSPLMEDPKIAAQFASDHVAQRGEHRDVVEPPSYWFDILTSKYVEGSEDSPYTGSEIPDAVAHAKAILAGEETGEYKSIPGRFTWLLLKSSREGVRHPCQGELAANMRKARKDKDCLKTAEAILASSEEVAHPHKKNAARVILAYADYWKKAATGNWGTLVDGF